MKRQPDPQRLRLAGRKQKTVAAEIVDPEPIET
jgi:hypothetical protein